MESIVNATERERGKNGIAWGQLHLVGHSLGAHICGFAAKELKKKSLPWIANRITGLDPAQPCFKNADKSMHLHKTDAPFVDVIHTNGKLLSEIGLGLPEVLGTVEITNFFSYLSNVRVFQVTLIFIPMEVKHNPVVF